MTSFIGRHRADVAPGVPDIRYLQRAAAKDQRSRLSTDFTIKARLKIDCLFWV